MILNTKQICGILVREGYGRWFLARDKKKQYMGYTCSVGVGKEGKHYLYLHTGSISSLKKHFKDIDNVTVHRVGKVQAQ